MMRIMALRTVAAVVPQRCAPFEFGLIHEVFGIDRSDEGVPAVDFRVCSAEPDRTVDFGTGLRLRAPHGLDGLLGVDLVALPACDTSRPQPPELLDAIRAAHAAGATVLSVCSGAFLLGEAGLLDGRPCTTHWMHTDELAKRFPLAKVDSGVLYVDDGDLITSAGTAAGIDACLHLVRRELGSAVATKIARRMVVPPQRDGGQRQYIEQPVPQCTGDSLAELLEYLIEHLADEHSVRSLARRAAMSERTFARRFVAETGMSPAKWIAAQRISRARTLLEDTALSIEQVAGHSGFGTAAGLRHHFTRQVGVAPAEYRRTFSSAMSTAS